MIPFFTMDDRSSFWCWGHFAQNIVSEKFRFYDYGLRNCEYYCSPSPPDIPIDAIVSKYIALFYSEHDIFAPAVDVQTLKSKLKGKLKHLFII